MATYVNDLRLTELATGEGSGTWGTTTNTNLELIGEALGYATQQAFGSDADATTTVADGVSDPARAMYYKITSAVSLTTTRTLTIAPNTLSRVMFIENATSGSQSIAISQGSGANVTIATGKTAVVYLDGAGSGAAVVDAMAGVDPGVTDTLAEVLVAGNATGGTDIAVGTGDDITFADSSKAIFGAGSDLQIYHDGSNSYIDDAGTGDLLIRAENNLFLKRTNSDETYLSGAVNGAVTLFHNNNAKIATTISGIDVTGSVTADGLDVNSTTSGAVNIQVGNAAGDIALGIGSPSTANKVVVTAGGSVGIGTTTPTTLLELKSTSATAGLCITAGNAHTSDINMGDTDDVNIQRIRSDHTNNSLQFFTDNTERLRIDSAGNVGIGTTSPTGLLHLAADNAHVISKVMASTTGYDAELWLGRNDTRKAIIRAEQISANSDHDLVFFTNAASADATEKVRITSAGNVGIGDSSPSSVLSVKSDVNNNVNNGILFEAADSTNKLLQLYENSVDECYMGFYQANVQTALIRTNGSSYFNGGNVGVGTSSPLSLLDIRSVNPKLTISSSLGGTFSGATTIGELAFHTRDGSGIGPRDIAFIQAESTVSSTTPSADLVFGVSASNQAAFEAMRLDYSGNLLVGKSATSFSTAGSRLTPDGGGQFVVSGGAGVEINRLSSFGTILGLYKDDAGFGGISVVDSDPTGGGGELLVASGNTGLKFDDQANYIRPANASGGNRDNIVDLGNSSNRFKDLFIGNDIAHLDAADNARLLYDKSVNLLGNAGTNVEAYNVTVGNGIYLGGTTAVNLLEDYEEGTWTPVYDAVSGAATYATQTGSYTKIGNKVMVAGVLQAQRGTLSGTTVIAGLPFAVNGNGGGVHINFALNFATDMPNLKGYTSGNQINFRTQATNASASSPLVPTNLSDTATTHNYMYFTAHYFTAA